jgi:cytochrome P450
VAMVDSGIPGLASTMNLPPYEAYDRMLEEPVRWDESVDGWVVSGYGVLKEVLRGDYTFIRHIDFDQRELVAKVVAGDRHLNFLVGEDHRRLHQWWLRLFSPTRVARYRESVVRPIVAATVDRFVALGETDLVTDFAGRIPVRVIAGIMGLPWEDDEWFRRMKALLDRVGHFFDRRPGDDGSDSIRASEEVSVMLLPVIRERRDGEGEDPISIAWREGPDLLPNWSEADVLGMVQTMFLAGTHTTSHAIANAAQLLLTRPEIAAQIRADESLESAFVEESLRLLGPAHFRMRRANEDFELGGVTIHTDDKILPLLAAADRDPGKYPHPHDFALDRRALRDHVAFNFGPRTCVGAALARLEIQESVHAMLHRLPNLRLAPKAPTPVLEGFGLRSYTPLGVKFDVPPGPRPVQPDLAHA